VLLAGVRFGRAACNTWAALEFAIRTSAVPCESLAMIADFDLGNKTRGGWTHFEGKVVEVHSLCGKLVEGIDISRNAEEELADATSSEKMLIDIDGHRGSCLNWNAEDNTYIVETFDGFLTRVPQEHLCEYQPETPEMGGFDFPFPLDKQAFDLAGEWITETIASKGYCVVQMFQNPNDRESIMAKAKGLSTWHRMKRELEAAYMGSDCNTKIATIGDDAADGLMDGAFRRLERDITQAARLLASVAEDLGVNVHGRTQSFLRMSYKDQAEQDFITPSALVEMDDSEDWSGDVAAFAAFARTRHLCMIYLIDNEGGDIWFYLKDDVENRCVNIPITKGKLVIFRHDLMDYSYQPIGESLAIQSWVVGPPPERATKEVLISADDRWLIVNPGLPEPTGPPAHILSLHAHFAANAHNEDEWWTVFPAGTDGVTQWPLTRWETEPYYMEGEQATQNGKSYTKHGGFMSQEQMTNFDNKFFGISDEDAVVMIPGQRLILETGYQILFKAGYNRRSLPQQPIGTWIGDVGPDWSSFQIDWARFFPDAPGPTIAKAVAMTVTAALNAHTWDLTGPVSSYDTACSASLVAMNAGHAFMFADDPPPADHAKALVMGVNTLLGPNSYIGNCFAGMLTHVGRCFTFNRAADGYQRGEGCGGLYFTTDSDSGKSLENRVAAVIGTCTNQDGRSASITAPNGPSQTVVIKTSMNFAGINVGTVAIAECHGTGTALGDPIEIGALQAVMRVRDFPIMKVSTKSHIGHLEAGAGIAGVTKCVMMVRFSCAPANCHFNIINPNLVTEGYPVIFDTEILDTGYSSGYCGVSSFGFGGTNSRADVYALAHRGPRKTVKIKLPLPSDARPVYESNDCFYIAGSWDAWATMAEMEREADGDHIAFVTLGDHRHEVFRLHANMNDDEAIHPPGPMCGSSAQVLGPDEEFKGKTWCIDGKADGVPPGTIYRIVFHWSSFVKRMSWAPCTDSPTPALGLDFEHQYFVAGTMTRGVLREMIPSEHDHGLYERAFIFGAKPEEKFQIMCDRDPSRVLYPADPSNVASGIEGPDCFGKGKLFSVHGRQCDNLIIQLRINAGMTTVTARSTSYGTKSWGSSGDVC